MAKKKKRRRSYKKKRKSAPKYKATPAGLAVGATASGMKAVFGTAEGNVMSMYDTVKTKEWSKLDDRFINVAMDFDTYKMALLGALVSASPRLPLVKIVASPINRQVKKLSKGKVSL